VKRVGLVLTLAAMLAFAPGGAVRPARAESFLVDRAVVRFVARETGGVEAPRFVYERELAFEARLEALSDGDVHSPLAAGPPLAAGAEGDPPYRPRHVRTALERHVAETVLESLGVDPPPTEVEIGQRIDQARLALLERVGGIVALREAAAAEGIGDGEIIRMLRRQALASLYLDRMVAPMLDPTEAELRLLHQTQRTPFSGKPFPEIQASLRRWVVGVRLGSAIASYYDGLRTRLKVTVLR
jgi:hypothetical protein